MYAALRDARAIDRIVFTRIQLGAKITCKILVNGQFWRFLTPMYLHAGVRLTEAPCSDPLHSPTRAQVLHLLFNLYGQLRIGLYLENRWGWIKLTFVYFTSGLGGASARLARVAHTIPQAR